MPFSLEQYLALATSAHNQRQRFMETVGLAAQPGVDAGNLADSLIALFDLDTAVGEQLDMVGEWIGLTRFITAPLEIWFYFDKSGLGLDQGRWLTPYESSNRIIELDDSHYRLLLRCRIAANYWDGTLAGAYEVWNQLTRDTGYQVLLQDGGTRAERNFGFEGPPAGGFDQSLWRTEPPLIDIYFTFDAVDRLDLGIDEGYWLGQPGAGVSRAVPRVYGNMHVIQALMGPPLTTTAIALFGGGYLGLKSAGVTVEYVTQNQPRPPPEPDDGQSGIGLPLFSFNAGPAADERWWMSYDRSDAGLDQAPLFYPGAHPIDPDFDPPILTFNGNSAETGLDAGWWTPPIRPLYLELDSTVPQHQLDHGDWYTPGAYTVPVWDPDQALPPTGVTYPPTALAGFDLGGWAIALAPWSP